MNVVVYKIECGENCKIVVIYYMMLDGNSMCLIVWIFVFVVYGVEILKLLLMLDVVNMLG